MESQSDTALMTNKLQVKMKEQTNVLDELRNTDAMAKEKRKRKPQQ